MLPLSPATSLLRDSHGELEGVVVVFREVTERHRREQALRERTDLLEAAFAAIPDAVYTHDAAGALLAANPAHRAALGYASLPEHHQRSLGERAAVLDPRDAAGSALPPHRWPVRRVLAGQTLSGAEACAMTVRGLDGVDRTFDVTGAPFLDAADRIAGGVLVSREIGERLRLRAERDALAMQVQQLIESERSRLHDVLEQIPAAIALTEGPEHRFTYVNPRYARWAGRSAEWLLGRTVDEAYATLIDASSRGLRDAVYRTGEPVIVPEVHVPDGWAFGGEGGCYTVSYYPVRGAGDGVAGVLLHAAEITEVVHTREQAAADRDRLQGVLDVLPAAVQIVDAQGRFVLANRASDALITADLTGQSLLFGDDEWFGRGGLRHLDGSPYAAAEMPLQRALHGGEEVRGEQLLLRLQGGERDIPILANVAPLRGADGAIAGAVGVFQDLSPIQELARQRDELLAAVAHDLKNPLTAIQGLAELLLRRVGRLDSPDTARLAEGLGTLSRAARGMAGQIDGLLDVARMQMGRALDLELAPTDLVRLLEGLVATYQQTTEQHALRLAADQPSLVARVDRARMERAVANLITNAVKYSPAGGEIVVILAHIEVTGGVWARIVVADQGIGIPPDDLGRVFEPFHRAANARGLATGTGLGLAGVRQVVAEHAGDVSIESTPGRGTRVTLRFPLAGPT